MPSRECVRGRGCACCFSLCSPLLPALALAHGTFDHLSVMREYASTPSASRARREHVWLALGSLAAAGRRGAPIGILCHRVPRLRAGVLEPST